MRSEDAPEIRELAIFRSISDDSFDSLIRGAYLQTFPPQVQLIEQGDAADFLHVLVEGSVELFAEWNRRETTMALLGPVSSFILAAAITDRVCLMSARTLTKSRIALIPSEDVRRVFREDPAFAGPIVADLADDFRGAVRQLKNVKLRSSVERLANYLLTLDGEGGADGAVTLPVEKRILASLLGMTPENLSRAFSTLQAYGVRTHGPSVSISDREDLERLAKPCHLIDDRG